MLGAERHVAGWSSHSSARIRAVFRMIGRGSVDRAARDEPLSCPIKIRCVRIDAGSSKPAAWPGAGSAAQAAGGTSPARGTVLAARQRGACRVRLLADSLAFGPVEFNKTG